MEGQTNINSNIGMSSKKKKSLLQDIWKAKQAYLFLTPMFIGLIVFCYYPPISGLYHAFFDWDIVGKATFVGIDNFKELFKDKIFLDSIPTLIKLTIPRLIISVTVPLIMAEMIFAVKNIKLKYWYRVLILLPMVTPGVVGLLIWKYIYDPDVGIATALARLFGFINSSQAIDWLGNLKTVIPSIIFMGFPWVGGTAVLIYMSGLMNISSEVIESSLLDGCNTFKRILKIDLPLLLGQVRFFVIFGLIGMLQDFGIQVVLTGGGPGYATYVPGYYMYTTAFVDGRMGYASAIGVVLFVTTLTLSLIAHRYLRVSK